MNTGDPSVDDYNKYIVIADPVRTAAEAEFADSLDDIEQNIASFQAAAAAKSGYISENTRDDLTRTEQNKLYVGFVNNMIAFLKENQAFRENMRQMLRDMNSTSAELTERIKSSK
jgi:hypothetical protein